jgi:hypothetical protein
MRRRRRLPRSLPFRSGFTCWETHSLVYENPDSASPVLAQVHLDRYVNVIGTTGDWLQVRLRTGIVGFIPAQVAEQVQTIDPQ